MKLIFLCLFILFSVSHAFPQSETRYIPGIIVTATDDTISCLVPLVQNFGIAVLTKKTPESRFDTIPVSKIKYLANGSRVYETVSFNTSNGMKQELMWLKEEGTLNLYELSYFNDAYTGYQKVSSGMMYNYGQGEEEHYERGISTKDPPTIICVIRKNDQNWLLSDKYFSAVMGPLVADKPDIAGKLSSKKYKLENVEKLVEEYNAEE